MSMNKIEITICFFFQTCESKTREDERRLGSVGQIQKLKEIVFLNGSTGASSNIQLDASTTDLAPDHRLLLSPLDDLRLLRVSRSALLFSRSISR